jgi:hypothetical protein
MFGGWGGGGEKPEKNFVYMQSRVPTPGTYIWQTPVTCKYCQVEETVNLSQFPPTSGKCDKHQRNHQSLFTY